MGLHKVQNIFIGDGTAVPAGATNVTPTIVALGDLAIVGEDNKTLTAGDTVADAGSIRIVQGKSSSLKFSPLINGRRVTNYTSQQYEAAKRCVWAIGYNRSTASGSIVATASDSYSFTILFVDDKNLFSERPLFFTLNFKASASATQSTIATQIVNAINNNTALASMVTAIKVGDGTGVTGLTAATNFGVEITGKVLTQFNTAYTEDRPQFSVSLNPNYGFSTTSNASIQNKSYGTGTYQQVYNLENFDYGYEGVLNRRLWPIPTLTYASTSTLVQTTITPTASITISEDKVTFSASVSGILAAGDFIQINNTDFEIKYFISSTVAIVTSVAAATLTTQAVEKLVGYDLINIEFSNSHVGGGSDVVVQANLSAVIAVPAGITASAYSVNSLQANGLLSILNPYMNSLGFASVSV